MLHKYITDSRESQVRETTEIDFGLRRRSAGIRDERNDVCQELNLLQTVKAGFVSVSPGAPAPRTECLAFQIRSPGRIPVDVLHLTPSAVTRGRNTLAPWQTARMDTDTGGLRIVFDQM